MWGISRICETPYVSSAHQSSSIHTTNSRCVLYIKAHDTLTGFRYQFLVPANWYQKPVVCVMVSGTDLWATVCTRAQQ